MKEDVLQESLCIEQIICELLTPLLLQTDCTHMFTALRAWKRFLILK